MPSTPEKPELFSATPIDCLETVRPPSETVSMYSVPEKEPEPYETSTESPVEVAEPLVNFLSAPTQVLEDPVSTISVKVCEPTVLKKG